MDRPVTVLFALSIALIAGCSTGHVQSKEMPHMIGMLGGIDTVVIGSPITGKPGVQLYDHGKPSRVCHSFERDRTPVAFTGFLNADGTVTPSPEWIAQHCKG